MEGVWERLEQREQAPFDLWRMPDSLTPAMLARGVLSACPVRRWGINRVWVAPQYFVGQTALFRDLGGKAWGVVSWMWLWCSVHGGSLHNLLLCLQLVCGVRNLGSKCGPFLIMECTPVRFTPLSREEGGCAGAFFSPWSASFFGQDIFYMVHGEISWYSHRWGISVNTQQKKP